MFAEYYNSGVLYSKKYTLKSVIEIWVGGAKSAPNLMKIFKKLVPHIMVRNHYGKFFTFFIFPEHKILFFSLFFYFLLQVSQKLEVKYFHKI